RPDRQRWQAATAGIAGLGEQLVRPLWVVRIAGEPGIEAEHSRRQDAPREGDLTEVHAFDDGLTIDRLDDRLPDPPIVERLGACVEAVEPCAYHRTPYVGLCCGGSQAR